MELQDGSRVAVVGGGPAGTLTSYFLLEMADRVDLRLEVEIFESKDFLRPGPVGCNMCGGIVSESLVQMLATEGINLPPGVVQRGLESYVLHSDVNTVRVQTPLEEMRIAALHRGSGPKGERSRTWDSFDAFLLTLAQEKGARYIHDRVVDITRDNGRPRLRTKGGFEETYDLLIGTVGVNSASLKLFEALDFGFRAPKTTKAAILELQPGEEWVRERLGNAMHVFLLPLPRLEFAAMIPKGEHVTICILGRDIDNKLVQRFLAAPEVACLLPAGEGATPVCKCMPRLNLSGAHNCFADRIALVGDSGWSRLYKDGIGAAYRTAKACAITSVFHGVSRADFKKHYWPTCRRLGRDNLAGKAFFIGGAFCRRLRFLRRAVLQMASDEQALGSERRLMSMILWDAFTGSAPYGDIFRRSFLPGFMFRFAKQCLASMLHGRETQASEPSS